MRDLVIRIVVSSIIVSIPFLQKTDIDSLIYIFPIAYIFSAYLLKDLSKYLLLVSDFTFFLLIIYITYNPLISILFFPLFISYLEKKEYIFTFSFFGLLTAFYSFYISEFIEFIVFLFWLPVVTSLFFLGKYINNLENKILQLKNKIENLTQEVSMLNEKNREIKIEKLDKIPFDNKEKAVFLLNQILKTSSVAYFDAEKQKCIYTNKNICTKEVLEKINSNFGELNTEEGIIVFIVEHEGKLPTGVYLFLYDNQKLKDSIYNFLFLKEKLNN